MVKKRSKRNVKRSELVNRQKQYTLEEAIQTIKKIADSKFDESVSLNFQLGIRAEQSDELVRGTVVLPHGSGKKMRVICICKGEGAREAGEQGADAVGAEDLIQKISEGWLEFDAVVAHPDMMRDLSKLGRILGPKGLMPSPKAGTVTPNVGRAVKELKGGRVEFRSDKTGGLHVICGKLSFAENALIENANVVIRAVRDAKPAAAKGDYLKKITLAPTQGPGFRISISAVAA
ncbi:MAG: 50S ribosomal protein L1 [Candidatus Omnitrophica bacterium]|nr:50S ribosomal protein L1 [Candidatus Omnitrophota bacterium]MDD5670227.1 50S ribosomal protein L1 [Candidatus Omnitrophota bacterium]